jgi:hypothetical protein
MIRRRRFWLALAALTLLALAEPGCYVWGRLHGEHFYRGRPTSAWRRQIEDWSQDRQGWTAPWTDRGLRFLGLGADPGSPAVLQGTDPSAVAVLTDLAHDGDAGVRQAVLETLSRQAQELAALFVAALKDPDPEVRSVALQAVAHLGPAYTSNVLGALSDPDRSVRLSAITTIRWYVSNPKALVPDLVALAANDPDPEVRDSASQAAREIDEEAAAEGRLRRSLRRRR